MRVEGQNQQIKFEEIMEKGEEDGISALPDCLLIEIVSRLPSTEDAIRTGTLSKRWQHLWASVHTLIFRAPRQCHENPKLQSDFALWVDKTLTQCRQLKLKKFLVHTFYDIPFESQFSNWIRFALRCNVEELNLYFFGPRRDFMLDQSIFINSCFTDLRLGRCKLNPSGAISWENLRSLHLFWVDVDQDLLVNILSGSPLLESLVLDDCRWLNTKGINSAPTSSLSLTQCRRLKHLKKFKVWTEFDIQFQSQLNDWILYAIRCYVKELNLWFWKFGSKNKFMLDQILFTSSCFTDLRLGGCMLNPVGAISWTSLRSLCISGYRSLDEDLIKNILSGSPVLETLVLNNCSGYRQLDITSKSVKNLGFNVYYYGECEADIIEINAPNILSLTINSNLVLPKHLLLNVPSLVKASFKCTCTELEPEVEQEMLKGHIMHLRHVKELEIGFYCAKVLSCLQAKGFVFPSNVKLTLVKDS